jgi:ASC-1-like (ASCH) protein
MKDIKLKIIEAGHQAVEQLIKVAKEEIIKPDPDDELAADRLKNAAATKKLAIFDAFEILNRIEAEREALEMLENGPNKVDTKQGFAERRSISGR